MDNKTTRVGPYPSNMILCRAGNKKSPQLALRASPSRRVDVKRRHAAKLASMSRVVEGAAAMHRGAVVPDHEVADAPAVPIDELRLCRVLDQVAKEQPSFGDRPADDLRRVRGEVGRSAPRARVR